MSNAWKYHRTGYLADTLVAACTASQVRENFSLTWWRENCPYVSEWYWVDMIFDILEVLETR